MFKKQLWLILLQHFIAKQSKPTINFNNSESIKDFSKFKLPIFKIINSVRIKVIPQ